MVSVLASRVVELGFEQKKIKDYKIGICCFSVKHATIRRKSKDWLTRNQGPCSQKFPKICPKICLRTIFRMVLGPS